MKTFRDNATCGLQNLPLGSQVTHWEEGKPELHFNLQRVQAPPHCHLPRDRVHIPGRTSQTASHLQNGSGPQPKRTKGKSYSSPSVLVQHGLNGGPVTMVTATASVTVSVHPTLPGATYQGYVQEGFDTDSELDCSETAKRTCGDKTKQFSSPKIDPLELQDLEGTEIQTKHQ